MSTFSQFELMVECYKFDIIAVTETWVTNAKQENAVKIDNYVFIPKNRLNSKVGGVAFYIREELTYKRRLDIEKYNTSIEHVWIEVKGKNKNSDYLVGCFYQPSSVEAEKRACVNISKPSSAKFMLTGINLSL